MKHQKYFFLLSAILILSHSTVSAHGWMAPEKEAKKTNPLEYEKSVIMMGETIYSQFCIGCHGKEAKGKDSETREINQNSPNLQNALKSHSDGDLFWKIQTGRNDMPPFKDELDSDEIWSVIHYIRSLGETGQQYKSKSHDPDRDSGS